MRTHGPVESDDAAVGEQFPQVIEGAPIAKADFHKRAFIRQIEIGCDMIEDIPLRGQPANETIESRSCYQALMMCFAAISRRAKTLRVSMISGAHSLRAA